MTDNDVLRIIDWALSSAEAALVVGGEKGPVWPKLDSGRVEDPPAVADQVDGKRALPVQVVSGRYNLWLSYFFDRAAKCCYVCQYTVQYLADEETHPRNSPP